MNILKRIDDLRQEHNWTEKKLAEEAGIPQSTISSWYRRKSLPTLGSLLRICDAFDITISQFLLEPEEPADVFKDRQFLRLMRYAQNLNPEQYDALIGLLKTI